MIASWISVTPTNLPGGVAAAVVGMICVSLIAVIVGWMTVDTPAACSILGGTGSVGVISAISIGDE